MTYNNVSTAPGTNFRDTVVFVCTDCRLSAADSAIMLPVRFFLTAIALKKKERKHINHKNNEMK